MNPDHMTRSRTDAAIAVAFARLSVEAKKLAAQYARGIAEFHRRLMDDGAHTF